MGNPEKKGDAADEEGDLIQEVKDDADDLDMSQYGKPVSSLAKPTKGGEDAGAGGPADAGQPVGEPEQKEKKHKKHKDKENKDKEKDKEHKDKEGKEEEAKEAKDKDKEKEEKKKKRRHKDNKELWSALDKEIEDVSEDDLDEVKTPYSKDKDSKDKESKPADGADGSSTAAAPSPKRGILPGGLSGGASLGANAPLKEGPKDHSFEIVDGEAKARVYDTPELRAAFLHYCKSSIKVTEMHLVHEGPFMQAHQFVQMCKEFHCLEPEGKMSQLMVGIIYTTSKSDDDEGLAFGQFLDSLVSVAFEAETNVAAQIQAEWDKKDVLNKQNQELKVRPRVNLMNTSRNPSAAGAAGPGEPEACDSPTGTPCKGAHPSRFHEILEQEGGNVVQRSRAKQARFQGVENLTHSVVLEKVNAVSVIKSMATSRATSVVNSVAASRLVSRRPSDSGGDDDEDEGDLDKKIGPAARAVATSLKPSTGPAFLTKHVNAALGEFDEGGDDNGPPSPGSSKFSERVHNPLRPSSATRLRSGSATDPGIAPSTGSRNLSKDLINKGFGDDDDDDDVDSPAKEKAKAAAALQQALLNSDGKGSRPGSRGASNPGTPRSAGKDRGAFGSVQRVESVKADETNSTEGKVAAETAGAGTDGEKASPKKKKNKDKAAVEAAEAEGTGSRANSARGPKHGVWKPAGKSDPLTDSRSPSRQGSARVRAGATDPNEVGAAAAAALKKVLGTDSKRRSHAGDAAPALPAGEELSPKKAAARQLAADETALMASFGQGLAAAGTEVAAAAAAADANATEEGGEKKKKEKKHKKHKEPKEGAGEGAEDEGFAFAEKKKAEMDAKLSAIEEKFSKGSKAEDAGVPTGATAPPSEKAAGELTAEGAKKEKVKKSKSKPAVVEGVEAAAAAAPAVTAE